MKTGGSCQQNGEFNINDVYNLINLSGIQAPNAENLVCSIKLKDTMWRQRSGSTRNIFQ